ncbi:hypothetical protein ACF3NX_04410 [Acetobacter orientalis]|uniref:hypothetical protein n=1 Tax=Acetobacter orientalis TaxID=146474 RepID=UPI003864E520
MATHMALRCAVVGVIMCLLGCKAALPQPICPHITPWSSAFQQQAAAELRQNLNLVALPEIARQDVVLRDQVRACQKGG